MFAFIAYLSLPADPPENPLLAAIRAKDVVKVRGLLRGGADPNAREVRRIPTNLQDNIEGGRTEPGDTALILATEKGSIEIMRMLLGRGAKVDLPGVMGETALFSAVRWRNLAAATFLLDHRANPNLLSGYGDPPLIHAASMGDVKMAKLLLDRGAKVDGGMGWSPLLMASYNGGIEVAGLLLKRGAKPNLRRRSSMLPLEAAWIQDHDDIAAMLLKAGAKGPSKAATLAKVERDSAAMRREYERQAKERQSNAATKTVFLPEDAEVMEAALADLAALKEERSPFSTPPGKLFFVNRSDWFRTDDGDGQMNTELTFERANEITLPMRRSLLQRNRAEISLGSFHPKDDRIVVGKPDMIEDGKPYGTGKKPWRLYVSAYLPGYDAAHRLAVFRFRFGPSPHGAAGTMLLVKEDGGWRVKWRDFAYYV